MPATAAVRPSAQIRTAMMALFSAGAVAAFKTEYRSPEPEKSQPGTGKRSGRATMAAHPHAPRLGKVEAVADQLRRENAAANATLPAYRRRTTNPKKLRRLARRRLMSVG